MAVNLFISVLLGRTLGTAGLGEVDLAIKISAVLVILALVGLESVLIKNIAISNLDGCSEDIKKIVSSALAISITVVLVIIFLGTSYSEPISAILFGDSLNKELLCMAFLLVVPMVINKIFGSALVGIKKVWLGTLVNETLSIWFVGLLMLVLHLFSYPLTSYSVLTIYLVARVLVSIIVTFSWNFKIGLNFYELNSMPRQMIKMGLPLLMVSGFGVIVANMSTIVLGTFATSEEVGLYSVAARLAILISFLLQVSNVAISPKLATLYKQGEIKEMEVMVQRITFLLLLISLLFFCFYAFAGHYILSLWGDGFEKAYLALIMISLGQVINVSTGCSGVLLVMCGLEKLQGIISVGSLVLTLILNVTLIYYFGLIGAAIATGVGLAIENLVKVIIAKRKLGILTLPILKMF